MDAVHALEQAVAAAADPAVRARALNALATELARTGQARRALELAHQARELATACADRGLDAQTLHTLARCHFYLADFVATLELLLQAVQRYQEASDLAGAATAFAGVGTCQDRLGAHDDAVVSLSQALESARELSLQALEINVHNSIAAPLMALDRLDEAAQHLAQGTLLAQSGGNLNLLTKLLLNQALLDKRHAEACAARGDDASAQAARADGVARVARALDLARQMDNRYDEAHCLGQMGTLLRTMGRHEQAEHSLNDALALALTLDERNVQAESRLELGLLHAARGRTDAACDCLRDAIELARRIETRPLLADACRALSAVLEQRGDLAGALALHKEFHALRETELANARRHAAKAARLWQDFQEASRSATLYRQRAESLQLDHAKLEREAEALDAAAQHDPLTGLLNRRGLQARIDALLERSLPGEQTATLALIDVDHFKQINDGWSHAVGDAVLRRIGAAIRAHCRQHDLPVRWGGDEFLLVLAGVDLATGLQVLQRFKCASDESPWHEDAAGLSVTLSIGVTAHHLRQPLAAGIESADRALYAAKRAGRDRIECV